MKNIVDSSLQPERQSLLLMEGGPLFHIERHLGLSKAESPRKIRLAVLSAFLTWVVLLVLSTLQGVAFGEKVALPFLHDYSAYTRFLLTIPLFILAELILGPWLAAAAEHFVTSGIIVERDFVSFDVVVEQTLKLRDSVLAEILIALAALGFSILSFRQTTVHVSTWFAVRSADGVSLTWAGWWLRLFCMPLLNFLVMRWLWRLYLWSRFLSGMRRLDLQLLPAHPDRAGGLGFVGETQRFFGFILFTYSIAISGIIANLVVYDKIPLQQFATAIGGYLVGALAIVILPLCWFAPKLFKLRRRGLYQYGSLATAYTASFHNKWIRKVNPEGEALLGTADIQSLADLGGSYEIVEQTRPLPMDGRTMFDLIVVTLLPMVPLLFTIMPFKEVVKLLFKFLV